MKTPQLTFLPELFMNIPIVHRFNKQPMMDGARIIKIWEQPTEQNEKATIQVQDSKTLQIQMEKRIS